jgi:hypothetical protein
MYASSTVAPRDILVARLSNNVSWSDTFCSHPMQQYSSGISRTLCVRTGTAIILSGNRYRRVIEGSNGRVSQRLNRGLNAFPDTDTRCC